MSTLEKVGENEWHFVEPECIRNLRDEFNEAMEFMENDKYELYDGILRMIIQKCPEHIDAVHHLAVLADIEGRDLEYYLLEKEAVDIAFRGFPKEFTLGKDLLEWGWLENRPFLRAYHGLGLAHLKRGFTKEALNIFRSLLSMNPNDNQGIRELAVTCYFKLDDPEKVLSICDKYSDDTTPELLYGRLLALIQLNKLFEAKEAAKNAVSERPLVANELLKKRHAKPVSSIGGFITSGGKDEAYYYWETSGNFWEKTKGALSFLRKFEKIDVSNIWRLFIPLCFKHPLDSSTSH